jgi:glycosyltransferase involved in cell wall biosynthesis
MKVLVLGIRGLPGVAGGVETHAEQLYPRLARLGCEVEVLVRSPFVPSSRHHFGTMRLRRLWAPRSAGFEALVHSVLGVCYAGIARPDILHIHAVGPAIVTPIARLLGLRVIVTHHGPDYERAKWGAVARRVLRAGERLGMRHANARVAISRGIRDLIRARYGRDSLLIPNGVAPTVPVTERAEIERHGLVRGRYFLHVSRIVPEKRQLDLIAAYAALRSPAWKLAIVGGPGSDAYSREVEVACRSAGVIMTGFLTGSPLQQMYAHAGAFVLPSSHEGLPIAILEALSYGLPVLASAIPANLEIGLPASSYFPLGDTGVLAERMTALMQCPGDAESRLERSRWVADTYDWERIADETCALYRRVLEA